MKTNSRTIGSQVSQPASTGKGADMSELQAHHGMTPEKGNWPLCCVSVISANKLSLQELNQFIRNKLLTSGSLDMFYSWSQFPGAEMHTHSAYGRPCTWYRKLNILWRSAVCDVPSMQKRYKFPMCMTMITDTLDSKRSTEVFHFSSFDCSFRFKRNCKTFQAGNKIVSNSPDEIYSSINKL